MKKDEVPQDPGFLEGFRRGALAVDEAGRFTLVPTPGWQAETAATALALEEQDALVRRAWERARAGRLSPLGYHAARRQMPTALLARNARIGRLRVWWHLRPRGFLGMPLGVAMRYAAALNVPLEELVRLPESPERLLDAEHG